MEIKYKEVYYDQYCKDCKYEKQDEAKDPCNDCLNTPLNTYSHKPVYFKEKDEK